MQHVTRVTEDVLNAPVTIIVQIKTSPVVMVFSNVNPVLQLLHLLQNVFTLVKEVASWVHASSAIVMQIASILTL